MPQKVHITLDAEKCPMTMVNAAQRENTVVVNDEIEVTTLPNGTSGGRSVVGVWVYLPDGQIVCVEFTARNFIIAAAAVKGWLERRGETY